MRALLTTEGKTYLECVRKAQEEFDSFFGDITYTLNGKEARPGVQIKNGAGVIVAFEWEVDFEAVP